MAKLNYKNGITSVVLRVKIMDTTSTTGAGKTGLTSASSGLIIATIADNEATTTAYTGANLETITTLGTFAAPTSGKARFKEVDATNHPGLYEIQIADARWAVSNARSVIVTVSGVSGAAQVDAEIQLAQAPADVTHWLGTAASTPTVAGVPNVNVKTWNDLTTVALPLVPTTAGRTLDVSTGGEAGLDWANVGSPTTALALTGTTIATTQKVDVETVKTRAVSAAGAIVVGGFVGQDTAAVGVNASGHVSRIVLADTITTYTGNTPQTGDTFARIGATGSGLTSLASASGLSAVQSDTDDIQTRLPAALVGGRMDVSVGAMAANTLTASALATDAVTEIQSGLSTHSAADVWAVVTRTITGGTIGTYTGNTPQTGDAFARLGAPVGASIAADINALPTNAELATALAAADDATLSAIAALNNITVAAVAAQVTTDHGSGSYVRNTEPVDVSGNVTAIKAKTDALPSDPADASDVAAAFGTVNATLSTIAGYIDTEVAAIKAKTDALPASPAAVGSAMTLTSGERNAIADAYLDRADAIETGLTIRQAYRLIVAAEAGKTSGGGTTTFTVRDLADTKNRIVATVTADGDRSTVTRDLT